MSTVYKKGRKLSPYFNCVSQETLNEMVNKALDDTLIKKEEFTTEFTNTGKSYFANVQMKMVVVPQIIPPQESPRPPTDQVSSNKMCTR
jgi:hypothetical protein